MHRALGIVAFVAARGRRSAGAAAPQSRTPSRRPAVDRSRRSDQYCVTCHNERLKTGGLALDTLPLDRVAADAETWEKVVRKVRAGLMPPAGAQAARPRRSLDAFAGCDRDAPSITPPPHSPNPGRAPLHRMNRVEYANAIRDLLALDVDAVDAASRRRLEPRLRQHRRRARRVAVAARALRRRGREDQPARRRRTRRGAQRR